MDDNVRDVSTRMVDYLVRHSLKMAMRQPASKVSAFNPSALIGRIGSIDPVTDVDTAFSASKKLSKTVENASEEGGGTPEMAAVAASVNALRSLRAMLRKNPDAATASINDLSSDIATAANAIGAASKSPRHVKLAIVSAITGEPLPSEDGEAGSAPQMEGRTADLEADFAASLDAISKASGAAAAAWSKHKDAAKEWEEDPNNDDLRKKFMTTGEDAANATRATDAARKKTYAIMRARSGREGYGR
jgi:hypothetical protein